MKDEQFKPNNSKVLCFAVSHGIEEFFVCTYLKEEHGLGQYSDSDAATFILMSN